jgi:DNA-binding beta-propeller fold protein YncE
MRLYLAAATLIASTAIAQVSAAGSDASAKRELIQLRENGCLVVPSQFQSPVRGCNNGGVGIANASSAAISPDGRGMYVASGGFEGSAGSVATVRVRAKGGITQPPTPDGCVSDKNVPPVKGCAGGSGLLVPNGVAVSPDGANVYVASAGAGSIAIFSRDPKTSVLEQLPQPQGCIDAKGPYHEPACTIGRAVGGAEDVAVSPDGRNVYVTTFFGLAIFSRDAQDGSLTQLPGTKGCLDGDVLPAPGCKVIGEPLDGATDLALSPDGRDVYVVTSGPASQGGAPGLRGSLLAFARDAGDGSLTLKQCLIDRGQNHPGCERRRALIKPGDVVLSGGGNHVYVLPLRPSGIDLFERRPDGTLRQPNGRRACIVPRNAPHPHGCRREIRRVVDINNISVMRGNLYASGAGNDTVGIFARNRANGVLRQRHRGCLGKPCGEPIRGLSLPVTVVPSPDAKNAYAVSSNSVSALRRR